MANKRSMLERLEQANVVTFDLLESKKQVWVSEGGIDGMYASLLNKEELGILIEELKELRGRME